MKLTTLTLSLIMTIVAVPAMADSTEAATEPTNEGHSYIGISGGPLIIGNNAWNDDGVMMTILYGYDFPDNNFSVEGEFGTTVAKPTSDIPAYGDLGVTTLGGYGVFRTSGRFYFTAKIGIIYQYLTSSVTGSITIDVDGPGLFIPIGVGGGMRVTERLDAEIEYTMLDPEIGYVSLGLNWAF